MRVNLSCHISNLRGNFMQNFDIRKTIRIPVEMNHQLIHFAGNKKSNVSQVMRDLIKIGLYQEEKQS